MFGVVATGLSVAALDAAAAAAAGVIADVHPTVARTGRRRIPARIAL
jgi:hypothetical protein